MIKIKSFFSDWKEVTKEKAQQYVLMIIDGMTVGDYEYKVNHIERKRLQGITVAELLKK